MIKFEIVNTLLIYWSHLYHLVINFSVKQKNENQLRNFIINKIIKLKQKRNKVKKILSKLISKNIFGLYFNL